MVVLHAQKRKTHFNVSLLFLKTTYFVRKFLLPFHEKYCSRALSYMAQEMYVEAFHYRHKVTHTYHALRAYELFSIIRRPTKKLTFVRETAGNALRYPLHMIKY